MQPIISGIFNSYFVGGDIYRVLYFEEDKTFQVWKLTDGQMAQYLGWQYNFNPDTDLQKYVKTKE
jgi:hypothetical protein